MGSESANKPKNLISEPNLCLWESEVYSESYFRKARKSAFRYYDTANVFKYLFFHWLNKWVYYTSTRYVEPYKLHPLPLSDQILLWLPIFSKHVSDGLVRLEAYHASKSHGRGNKVKKPYRSILLRALFLTLWKRVLLLVFGILTVNVLSMSISILVKRLLEILNNKSISFVNTLLLLLAIIACQVMDGLFISNLNFYVWRLIIVVKYLFSIASFQHFMVHRPKFVNVVNGHNPLNVCNNVLHSCAPDSECSKSPLYCQALRHHNKDINSRLLTFQFNDMYFISLMFESINFFTEFLCNFIYGIYLLSLHVKVNLLVLYISGALFLFFIITIEVLNALVFKFMLYIRDYRIAKSNDAMNSLSLIQKMFYDDIAINIITRARNIDLSLTLVNVFLTFLNTGLYCIYTNLSFLIIQKYFSKSVNNASVVTDIDTAGFMTTFYIFLRIVNSMFLVPMSINIIGMSYVCFKRVDRFLKECSPNFYITDNKYPGNTKVSTDIADKTDQIPKDAVVYYKDATFTWVNSREDLLNHKYELYLQNVNFELKRGEMVIVLGAQGAGKSNFIKSMLGEMTLVGGSMAVVPLYTSMPIFYASQDIFLQHGTIRSNIAFGHKFDEDLYNQVLKAVELEFDISTWEKGDMRVVSDNAHSLSGGQRVRMEMARAVYAYLVFHKVNEQYNNSKCSFLMLLDSSFHGLDPYVSKTIFNNLFNQKTGLLMKGDLSVVLTSTRTTLDICLNSSDLKQLPNPPIYNIKNEAVKLHSNLHDFIRNKERSNDEFKYLSSPRDGPCHINYLTSDIVTLCSPGATKAVRREETISKYNRSFKSFVKEELSGIQFNRYFMYINPALALFLIYTLITMSFYVMENLKFIFASNLSDYIDKAIKDQNIGTAVDLSEIKARSNNCLKLMIILVSSIVILSMLAAVFSTLASIIASRKIHEYSVDSIFKNSAKLKIREQINQLMTFFSLDVSTIDDSVSKIFSLSLISLIQTLMNLFTVFYLIPISIPFILTSLVIVCFAVLVKYVNCVKSINFAYLESSSQVTAAIERAITGCPTYRSFKQDYHLVIDFIEHVDYTSRTKCKLYSIVAWSAVLFNWIFSAMTLLILVIPIILDKYTKFKLKVGYFGLALSLCMSVIKSFNKFSLVYSKLEVDICSVERFQYFVPVGESIKFAKSLNTHEEYIVNPSNKTITDADRKQLFKRRAVEFKTDNRRFYHLRRLFYHPKITILDIGRYLTPEHSGVELSDVCVFTSPDHNADGMILKHLTVSAHRSEIIGMVGRTGAGKTTLLSALQNIIANRTGQVLLDGKDLNEIPKTVLRQIVGVLPQLPFVFKGWTIRRFLDPRKLFTDDEINRALDQCGLLRFVNELPGGKKLDAVIVPEQIKSTSDKYKKSKPIPYEKEISMSKEFTRPDFDSDILSYNQLRTLWLARLVLYRHFYRIIVVDEPPEENLVDENTGRNDDLGVPIYELLKKYFSHCTTFVTAHDANVLQICSSVWVIHDGCLIRTCRTSDIPANESIANIIEESVIYS